MFRKIAAAAALLALAGCATRPTRSRRLLRLRPIEVQILAFNDFHGNLEPPPPVEVTEADGSKRKIQTGGVANLAARIDAACVQGIRTRSPSRRATRSARRR